MISKALHRAATSWKIFIAAAVLFSLGVAGSTYANSMVRIQFTRHPPSKALTAP